jgi:hypothetical protein
MMRTYKIKVTIDIAECEESGVSTPTEQEDGSFAITLSEREAIDIDRCEQSLLQTSHPAIRAAISRHLSALSKKKPLSAG